MGFQVGSSPEEYLRNILDAPPSDAWAALKRVLSDVTQRRILIVIDGLCEVGPQTDEIIEGIHGLTDRLQKECPSFKVLFTGQAQYETRQLFDKSLCIEYDKERQDCLASLHFSDRRYDKIVKEHKGSLEWIWEHEAYKQWSTSDESRLLYIEGKPGSGKSTLVKYFRNHLQERESAVKTGIMAKFFYSHREGELHSSHTNMLRTVLCDILHQNESFFYHRFQYEYRRLCALQPLIRGNVVEWDYESLKEVFSSLFDYSLAGRLYIILDAVDESAEKDRQDMLQLLLRLCEKTTNYVVKVFVASRPLPQLERSIREPQGLIRLQDETKADIANFARSYLERLEFEGYLEEAMEYIVENAQGVFLWVQLVVMELLDYDEQGRAEGDIFEFLKSLPRELEEFYECMLDKMGRREADLRHGIRMFYFVLFACRPLAVDELLHSVAIQDTHNVDYVPSDDDFRKSIPRERRITYCGGNFLEIKQSQGYRIVQIMHQTVREFFLKPDGYVTNSKFKIVEKDAQNCISRASVQYLMLCAANILSVSRPPDVRSWTPNHFESFAKYLDGRPLAAYALRYLEHHVNKCDQDLNTIVRNMSQFMDASTCVPVVALKGTWVQSRLDKTTLVGPQDCVVAAEFRDKLLRTAAKKGFPKATENILLFGANVNAQDNLEQTVLSYATENGHKDVVAVLLSHKSIDPDARDTSKRTPLLIVAGTGNSMIVSMLLGTQRVKIDSRDKHGRTALSYAAERGHKNVVKLLLDSGAKVDAESEWSVLSRSPLSYAAENGHESIVDLLLARWDISVDYQDSFGRTPLSYAAEKGHLWTVGRLLAHGKFDVNSENDPGRTPLSYAAEYGHEAIVKLLLWQRGIMVNSADLFGRTPLAYAIAEGNQSIVKVLEFRLRRPRTPESRSESDHDSESGSFTIRTIEDSRDQM